MFDSIRAIRGTIWVVKKVIVLVLGALALLPVAHAAPARTVRVAITDLDPFTVHGSGFLVGGRVTITVEAKQRALRRAVANTSGAFTARFVSVHLVKCNSYVVRAVGSRGSVAIRKVSPECPPPANAGDEPAPPNPLDPTPK